MESASVYEFELARGKAAGLSAAEAGFRAEREELRAQRGELLAALKEAREWLIAADSGYGTYDVEIAKTDVAIARAEGGK